jgi:hypothetical protein
MRNKKAENYNELVESLLLSYQKLDFNVSLKVILLNYYQDTFSLDCQALNSEHGEYFRQDVSTVEKTDHGKRSSLASADKCWTVTPESPGNLY